MTEQLIPGLGALDLDQMRSDLDAWSAENHDLLAQRQWISAFKRYPRPDFSSTPAPFAAAPKDIRKARVLLIGSAGISAPDQQPFDARNPLGDYTFRLLPTDFDLASATVSHDHYSHEAADADRNVVYPLDRLRDLVELGEIGALTDQHIAFMGYQPDYVTLIEDFLPALTSAAKDQQADLALLVPV